MKRFRVGFDWYGEWSLHLYENWYDGPFWDLQIGPIFVVWNLDGLPYIFQEPKK